MHALAAYLQVKGRILGVQYQVAGTGIHGFLHHVPGHAQATIIPQHRAVGSAGFDTVGGGLVEAYFFQNPQAVLNHGCNIRFAEGLVVTATLARMYRFLILAQGRGSDCDA